jgi:hypothetical protein
VKLTCGGKLVYEGTFGQCIAHVRSVGVDATAYELGGVVIESIPPFAPKAARKPKAVKLALVERTDEDASYGMRGYCAGAKVSVIEETLNGKVQRSYVCAKLTFRYGEPCNMTAPKKETAPKLTREEWLMKLTREHLTELFAKSGAKVPRKLRMSCGWPSNRALASNKGTRVLGQCWYPDASDDAHHEIFITPAISDGAEVAAVLAHELVHACMEPGEGHGRNFRSLALEVGLEGKMTQTVPGDWLKAFLAKAIQEVGAYPHATLDMSQRKKQTTRLLKVVCINEDCSFAEEEDKAYSVRMSSSVFEAGAPKCGCCGAPMEEAPSKEGKG